MKVEGEAILTAMEEWASDLGLEGAIGRRRPLPPAQPFPATLGTALSADQSVLSVLLAESAGIAGGGREKG